MKQAYSMTGLYCLCGLYSVSEGTLGHLHGSSDVSSEDFVPEIKIQVSPRVLGKGLRE